jgi:Nif-specific regulatory protein
VPEGNAHLVVRDPVSGNSVVPLVPGQRLTLGRAPTNHVVLHDERASRFHAEIFEAADGWTLRDLQSRNGTLIRAAAMGAAAVRAAAAVTGDRRLDAGDSITIGRVEIVYADGVPPDAASRTTADLGGTATQEVPADIAKWQSSIIHRRSEGRLLAEISETAERVPKVARAAGDLCRLAFALARATDLDEMAELSLSTAAGAVRAVRGMILLADRHVGDAAATVASLAVTASRPPNRTAAPLHLAAASTVLAANEAMLAGDDVSIVAAPIRRGGVPIGVMLLELDAEPAPQAAAHRATADDLDLAMAVCDAIGVAIENLAAREELSSRLATTTDEVGRLRRRLGEESRMVGQSAAIEAIIGQVGLVAATKATVLIRGESGAGKELVARAIHEASDRAKAPFVCLNCAALSETLLESELFGHEKGAFTGATERKNGKFEAADKGTLFLDEIGEMSPAIQAKFLRVLEGHPFERVGGSGRVKVDVRVVAATNRNLEDAVIEGLFRRDLYFRLKVVEILVPPLRKRPEDVERLAKHFLEMFAMETRRRVKGFTAAAMGALREYRWPGNVRELRNVVERAVVLSQKELIDIPDLALCPLGVAGDTGAGNAKPQAYVPESLDEVEKRHILATIEASGGNKTKAAAILGIERSTLDRKLARWAAKPPKPEA